MLKKKSDGEIKFFKKDGVEYHFYYMPMANEVSSQLTFTDEEYVRKDAWYPFIKEGDVILDIGASYLSYTLPALALGATVYAFSPEHEFYHVQKSLALNEGFADRCKLYDYGFYSRNGFFKTDTMEFIEKEAPAKMAEARRNIAGWYIPVITVDEFVDSKNHLTQVDFLKIDTEGAEFEILKGAETTLNAFHPKILIEYHLFKDDTLRTNIEKRLLSKGYKAQVILDKERPDLPHVLYY